MNKESLSERVMKIRQEMEETKMKYAQLEGHLNETLHWITQLAAPKEDESYHAEEGNQEPMPSEGENC